MQPLKMVQLKQFQRDQKDSPSSPNSGRQVQMKNVSQGMTQRNSTQD
mgnify:CR=1 FL=1